MNQLTPSQYSQSNQPVIRYNDRQNITYTPNNGMRMQYNVNAQSIAQRVNPVNQNISKHKRTGQSPFNKNRDEHKKGGISLWNK